MIYYTPNSIVYHNGQFKKASEATTDLFSQTLHYGTGAFEGMRSYQTAEGPQIFQVEEHLSRLITTASKLGMELQQSPDDLQKVCEQLLSENRLVNAYLRPLVYMGPNMNLHPADSINIFIAAWQWGPLFGDQALSIKVPEIRKFHPQAFYMDGKVVGNYVNSAMAVTEVKKQGYDAALLLDEEGWVAQGPAGNFFYEKDEVLYTPPLGNIFPGITRQTVFELAKQFEIEVVEKKFKIEETYQADSAFFTGTAAELAPIQKINDQPLKKNWEETTSYFLSCKYNQLVRHHHLYESTVI